jgi:transmembrane sensor
MTASTFATNATQQAAVTLPDGTRVLLSPRTTLHATGIDGRTVTLDSGEAYFDVATHASVPFIVRSGAMTTRVLGTAFLIRRDPHHAHVRVSVTEGKVRVTTALAHREDLTVTAGQIGDLTDSTTRLSALDDLPPGMERKRDEMVFYHTPVASVLGVIGQWYGLQFHCVDSALLRRSVTIGLSTQSSAEVFSVLQDLLDVNVAVHGDTVTLAARSPRPQPSSPRMRNYDIWTPTRENGR